MSANFESFMVTIHSPSGVFCVHNTLMQMAAEKIKRMGFICTGASQDGVRITALEYTKNNGRAVLVYDDACKTVTVEQHLYLSAEDFINGK